ncbi:uncharacterized protein LOC124917975 [Impatiens glandulifera]|uniref:uncharacterized protein LOC124917975 n=1 Tax=Impatiens glandulifera TaxID=253017 RepID=UPI001FB1A106|nr:uncharacterized protein LOC124917975 [Impatiens glandulifera]
MGMCVSSESPTRKQNDLKSSPTAKRSVVVIDLDGHLQEFNNPIRACHVLSKNQNGFLCSSETLNVGTRAEMVTDEEELVPGNIYFLMPLSKSDSLLTLEELCYMAIKASKVLTISSFVTVAGN